MSARVDVAPFCDHCGERGGEPVLPWELKDGTEWAHATCFAKGKAPPVQREPPLLARLVAAKLLPGESIVIERASPAPVLSGGPEVCLRPCSECSGEHHFSTATIDFADDPEPDPDLGGARAAATAAGCVAWYVCKHCDAWRECSDDDDEDGEEGPVIECEATDPTGSGS